MLTFDKLKEEAISLIIQRNKNGEATPEEKKIYRDYLELSAKYHQGEKVWCIEEDSLCKATIVAVHPEVNNKGIPISSYRLQEETGRTMFYGQFVDEERLFPSREALVEHYKKILGI